MKTRSIQFRLTAWYLGVLLIALVPFGLGTWYVMRRSLYQAVDDSLRDRVAGVRRFMEAQIEALSQDEIRQEFREHSVLGPGGDLFQVCDAHGNWLYRSVGLAENDVSILPPNRIPREGLYEDRRIGGTAVRLLSRRIQVRGQAYTVQVTGPMEESLEALHRFRWALVLMVPVVVLVASVGGYWMSRRALGPVDAIIRDAQSIGERNLDRRLLVPRTGDELERLSETLNQMLERLALSFRRITQFTADASHELRTPVALIRTTAELALRKKRPSVEREEALRQILFEAERASGLIENLLTLARADSGKETLRLERTDVSAMVRETAFVAGKMADGAGIQLEADVPDHPIMALIDSQAIRRVILILLDNAFKYTPAPGKVDLSLGIAPNAVVIEVRDSGIGILSEDLPHIFERFYQADKARSGNGGAGLGLAIARWIVEQHGGSIGVESSSGQGTLLRVTLPVASATA